MINEIKKSKYKLYKTQQNENIVRLFDNMKNLANFTQDLMNKHNELVDVVNLLNDTVKDLGRRK